MNDNLILREATGVEIAKWDQLIGGFKNHRISHTYAWLRSLENSFQGKLVFIVYEKNGEIVACLPGMIVKIGFFRLFGSPLPGWQTVSMGPVFDENRVSADQLIVPLSRFLEKTYGVHHIEIMSEHFDQVKMEQIGFRGKPEFTFQTPLYPSDEKRALSEMKTNARRNISRGIKLGLRVSTRSDEAFVDEIYDQICEVFIRGGNTVPFKKIRVSEFFENMKEKGSLLAVSVELPDQDVCIATGLFTIENKELVLWTWTHRSQYRWYRPTELMTWFAMQKAMEMGCERFDMMGRGDFKAKFGATIKGNKIRWVRSRYRWLTFARDIAEKGYRFQQSFRGKIARRRSEASQISVGSEFQT